MDEILVTGATGFIGSHLVEALLKNGYIVHCLIRNPNNLSWLKNLPVKLVYGELLNENLQLPDVDYVFHTAGIVKAIKKDEFYKVNYEGTLNLIKNVLKQKRQLKGFTFVSTLAVNGNPTSDIITDDNIPAPKTHYAKSKWLAEKALLEYKDLIPITIFRPTAMYGPRDKEFLNYFKIVKKGFAPILNKKGLFSFCYVLDLVEALIATIGKKIPSGEVFFISDGYSYKLQDFINILGDIMDKKPKNIFIPLFFTYLMAFCTQIYSFFSKKPLLFSYDKLKEIFQRTWVCDISKAKSLLGFKPAYSLAEGLKITLRWYIEYGWI